MSQRNEWQNGRQLARYEDYSFTYNADGILINQYLKEINALDGKLSAEYATYVESLTQSYAKFLNILTSAFSTNAETAFNGSIALALEFGVPSTDILDSYSKISSYFTE